MSYELFKDTRAKTKEYISVTENYTFGLPRVFIDRQGITSDHKAIIFFDPDLLKIALHFTLTETKFGLSVRIPNEKQGGLVVAKSFFELKNIDPKKYGGRYHDFEISTLRDLGFDKDGTVYIIQLVENDQSNQRIIRKAKYDIKSEPVVNASPEDLNDIPF